MLEPRRKFTFVIMRSLRKILFPFAILYGLITFLRNYCFDKGILKSKKYNLPIIAVGNLNVGGTGKTPMVEYLIRLLQREYKVATLSRGYKRKSEGFVLAKESSTADDLGDEPMQFHSKYKKVNVAVDANRQHGIAQLQELVNPEVLILDDAYQHRKVTAGFYVLLTKYQDLYVDDFILPAGNLREARSGAKRADVIVITKCPENLSQQEQEKIVKKLEPLGNQQVFFCSIAYDEHIYADGASVLLNSLSSKFTLVTGIANPKPLLAHLNRLNLDYEHLAFKDHHHFSEKEITMLASKKQIVTTEKDYMRLKGRLDNVMCLPIKAEFLKSSDVFDTLITAFVEGSSSD